MKGVGGAVVRWCGGAVVRWCGGAVVRWCGGAVVRWCGGVCDESFFETTFYFLSSQKCYTNLHL